MGNMDQISIIRMMFSIYLAEQILAFRQSRGLLCSWEMPNLLAWNYIIFQIQLYCQDLNESAAWMIWSTPGSTSSSREREAGTGTSMAANRLYWIF